MYTSFSLPQEDQECDHWEPDKEVLVHVTGSDTKVGRVGEEDKRSMLLGVMVGQVGEEDKRSMLLGVIPRLVGWERGIRGVCYWE